MLTEQLDLFRPAADTRRLAAGLTCLRDSVPEAMYVVIHLAYWRDRNVHHKGASGEWVYCIRRGGLHYEGTADAVRADWAAIAAGEPYGWDRTPIHLITWPELAEQIGGDPRRGRVIAWARSLTAPDSWIDLARPHELWPSPEQWHPDYITGDRARAGWSERIAAWRDLYGILDDAIARLEAEVASDA